jgi:hypothetical protein
LEMVMGDPLKPNLPPLGRRWMGCGADHDGTNSILTLRPSARAAISDLVSSFSLSKSANCRARSVAFCNNRAGIALVGS